MGKQPLTRKKNHQQQRLVFAEKNLPPKRDSKSSHESSRSSEDRDSDDDDSTKGKKSPETNLFQLSSVTETSASYCSYPDVSSLSSCCDNKVVCKTKSINKPNAPQSDELKSMCSCSSSFTCPSHTSVPDDKASSVNPFPTKRRVGSMKSKVGSVHSYKQ